MDQQIKSKWVLYFKPKKKNPHFDGLAEYFNSYGQLKRYIREMNISKERIAGIEKQISKLSVMNTNTGTIEMWLPQEKKVVYTQKKWSKDAKYSSNI